MKKIILILFLANSSFCMDKSDETDKKEPAKDIAPKSFFQPRMNPPTFTYYEFDAYGKAVRVEWHPKVIALAEILKQNKELEASQKAEN